MTTMHTGKELGEAIRIAIERKQSKGVEIPAIAAHFGVKVPSVYDWMKKGSIDKGKLPALWRFFADVASLEHWGLSLDDFACFGLTRSYQAKEPSPAPFITTRQRRIAAIMDATEAISDDGLVDLAGYAKGLAKAYPRAKSNHAN